ncbi:hypothetical protein [Piscinibacter sakaiensis]|uniref:Uncharacterized protein n=1 Tax=Piscinibacter sakaiensis TaxID=1547922 RepID=A0A0K8P0U5_PISS1|nr:hypothetical protein [Piscinibacter sakaiensis]GAP35795.1 hypothetical protein ISF6_1568 [Piscinibacter sakaiensis]
MSRRIPRPFAVGAPPTPGATPAPPGPAPGADGAAPSPQAASWYRLDAADRLVAVSSDWDRFALDNQGPGACAGAVLGRSLFDFVLGEPTRRLLELGLAQARRSGRRRTLAYRCDAPDRRRELRMVMTPLLGGSVLVEHRLVSSRTRAARTVQPSAAPAPAGWRRCSQCQRLQASDAAPWCEADAVGPSQWPAGQRLAVQEVVCPDCQARLPEEAVADAG